jgi:superfamily II DNA/RNA helicase
MFTVSDRLRDGCHILSATTGRLKDMVEKGRVRLILVFNIKNLQFFIQGFIKKSEIFRS